MLAVNIVWTQYVSIDVNINSNIFLYFQKKFCLIF